MEVKLPLSVINRKPQCSQPLIKPILVGKTYMNRHRFFMRDIVNGFEDKTVVILVFGPSKDVISEVVRFYFLLPLREHEMFVQIEP